MAPPERNKTTETFFNGLYRSNLAYPLLTLTLGLKRKPFTMHTKNDATKR
jgi:hypothetical protein